MKGLSAVVAKDAESVLAMEEAMNAVGTTISDFGKLHVRSVRDSLALSCRPAPLFLFEPCCCPVYVVAGNVRLSGLPP